MERIQIRWHDAKETVSIMETEEQAYNFKINMRDFDTEQADFTAYFDDATSINNILHSAITTHSAQLHKTYLLTDAPSSTLDIQVVKGHNVVTGDYLTAGSEVLYVNSVDSAPTAYDVLNVDRAIGASKGNVLYQGLIIYNATPRLGLECYLYDATYTYPVRWLYIKEISSVGAGYEILFSDVINKWNKDVAIPPEVGEAMSEDISQSYFEDFAYIMRHLADLIDIPYNIFPSYQVAQSKLFEEDVDIDNLSLNVAEILKIFKKVSNSYLIFNKEKNTYNPNKWVYTLQPISPLSVETLTTSLELDPKILMEKGYKFEKLNAGYNLKMSYKYQVDETTFHTGTILRTGFGGDAGTTIEIDMSKYRLGSVTNKTQLLSVADDILASYKPMYARSVGVLTVDIPYEDTSIEVGLHYTWTDIAKFDVLLDTTYTVYLYCISRDNDEVVFLVLQTEKTAYIGVAMPMYRVSDNVGRVPSWYMMENKAFYKWEDTYFHNRKISGTLKWSDTVDWYIMDLETMLILEDAVVIENMFLDAYQDLYITFTTDALTTVGTRPLLLKAKTNAHTPPYFISENIGV